MYPSRRTPRPGPSPVSITERGSCWSGCALFGKGCYAFYGALGHFWTGVSDGTCGSSRDELCTNLAKLPRRTLWRYAQAGDLPGSDDAIDEALLRQLVTANRGKRGDRVHAQARLADTVVGTRNRRLIAEANAAGFTINPSANYPAEADLLADLKIAPIVTILDYDYGRRVVRRRAKSRPDEWAETIAEWRDRIAPLPTHTPAGRRIAICPARTPRPHARAAAPVPSRARR